jgi:hypothetical protein
MGKSCELLKMLVEPERNYIHTRKKEVACKMHGTGALSAVVLGHPPIH